MSELESAPAPLFERQPNETVKRFEAFTTYRDLGSKRNLPEVARVLGKSAGLMYRWSAEDHWSDRIAAWQDDQDRQVREWQQEGRREAVRRLEALSARALDEFGKWLEEQDPEEWNARDAVAVATWASKHNLLAVGAATEAVEHQGSLEITPKQTALRLLQDAEASEMVMAGWERAVADAPGGA